MSEFHVEVVRIDKIGKHPNADNLEITTVRGAYTAIIKAGQFKEGELAVWVPEDSIVPSDDQRWTFLGTHTRIKAKRIRGIFSMGVLTHAESSWTPGQNVQNELRIKKWEPELSITLRGENEKDPGILPIFTDIESFRRYPESIKEGTNVVLLEKIHGTNSRFVYKDERLWTGSHNHFKKESDKSLWWIVARKFDLSNKLKQFPGMAIYGEIYGQVQKGFDYGVPRGEYTLALFDIMDTSNYRYLNYDQFVVMADKLGLPTVPLLYHGPWKNELLSLQNGPSTVTGANNIREGFVIKPDKENWDPNFGRLILKMVGEDYLEKKHK